MNDEQRKTRYDAAIAELGEFCRLFGFGLRLEAYDGGSRPDTISVVLTYGAGRHPWTVMRVDPNRQYGRAYPKPYAMLEKTLARLRNGAELKWVWSKVEPAEGGSVKTTCTRTYRLPKFSSVQELRILLMARGSEFAAGEDPAA